MIITRKEAYLKIRASYQEADKEELINLLMADIESLTNGELKSFLEYKYKEFVLIEGNYGDGT